MAHIQTTISDYTIHTYNTHKIYLAGGGMTGRVSIASSSSPINLPISKPICDA